MEEHHDRGPIKPRSWRDRAAIVDPSAWNRFHDPQTMSKVDRDQDQTTIVARSRRDRGSIVVRSWLLLRLTRGQFTAKSGPIHRGIEATISAHGIAPSTPSNHFHDHFNCPRFFRPISLLKSHVFSLCSSTFD